MNTLDISTRRRKILEAIINAYIKTASPVSSEAICNLVNLGVSPATIRNDMAELEEEDMILQLHTSSGRIPTYKGYRYYVNILLDEARFGISPSERERIRNEYKNCRSSDRDEMLQYSTYILSEFTNNVGVVLLPRFKNDYLKRIEIVSLGGGKILCVLVTTGGVTRSTILNLKEDIKEAQINSVSRFINSELSDIRLEDIEARLVVRLLHETDSFYHLLKIAIEIIRKSLSSQESDRICIGGRDRAVKQPEFINPATTCSFLHTLEDMTTLSAVLCQDMGYDSINVHIGEEDLNKDMREFSVITKTYKAQGKVIGILGIIGPVRMDYPKTITVVNFTADLISDFLSQ